MSRSPYPPPRLAGLGFADTVTMHSDSYRVLQPPAFVNQYAALPSLHVGWNLLVGIVVASVAASVLVRWLAGLLPVLMSVAVVTTGNHYVVDGLAGASLALFGLWVAYRLEARRQRPTPEPSTAHLPAPRTAADDALRPADRDVRSGSGR